MVGCLCGCLTVVLLTSAIFPTTKNKPQPIDFKELEEASESLSSFLAIDLELKALPEKSDD